MTLPFNGQAASLVIGEAQASGSTRRAENPVLLEQVLNDRERLSIDPTGEQKEKEGERPRQRIHRESVCNRRDRVQGRYRRTSIRRVPEQQPARDGVEPPLAKSDFGGILARDGC